MEMKNHPLMLTLKDVISGNGFLCGVTLSGRALMRQEDGKWWMYGVRPAGLAGSGETVDETFSDFRKRYKEELFDIAEEASTFEGFRLEVQRFFDEPDPTDEGLWNEALLEIRDGQDETPAEPFSRLLRESPESNPAKIIIDRLDGANMKFKPSDNVSDTLTIPLAA